MAYSYPEIKSLLGLYQQRNSFTVPDGALEEASNITIKNDNIWSSRRGFHIYSNPISGVLNNLFLYQDKLMAVFNNKISHYADTGSTPNETGTESTLSGATILNSGSRISRDLKSNSNLYFTSDNGVLKLTSYNSAVYKVGAPQGLDLGLRFINNQQSNALGAGNIVGYRVLFGYKDNNDNLILGAPSQINEITNTKITTATASAASGSGPYTLTVTQAGHGLESNQYLVFSSAEKSGSISEPNAEGTYKITVTGADTFTYQIANTTTAALTQLHYGFAMPVRLESTIPSEVSTDVSWFAQIYRSSQQSSAVGIFSDFKLISEVDLTSSDISAGLFYFDDDTDDILLGAELYTNENSREGELQANYRPPLCDDIATFKGHSIYAKATTRHLIDINLIDTTVMANDSYISIKVGDVTRTYVAQTGVGNQTVLATVANNSGIEITHASHGFANGDKIYIDNISGSGISSGFFYVINTATDTFKISTSKGGGAQSWTAETTCEIQGVTETTNDYPMFFLSGSSSASTRLRSTAEAITKAINRDSSSLVYGSYISTINDVPGKFRLQGKGFTDAISLIASSSSVGSGFSPVLPTAFDSGTQVISKNENLPHTYYCSKEGEPEAVPLINRFPVGSKNSPIFRIAALRDSLIVLKGDGVWRITGDGPNSFVASLIDGTVICVAPNSVDVINNQVAFLSNQGVCFVTESSVQILSREGIEDPLQPVLGQTSLASETAGLSYESDRLYLLTTTLPNNTSASVTYAYNIITQEWSTWDRLFSGGIVGPRDKLFYINKSDNDIYRERKNQDRTDYADQNYATTVNAISGTSATVTVSGGVPKNGDMLVKSNIITRIVGDPVLIAGSQYSCEVASGSNLSASDTPILYSAFKRTIKLAPFHAGLVGRMKLFSQMQIHLRDDGMSKCQITFSGQTFGGSQVVNWESQNLATGWGFFPWGFKAWGQETGLDLTTGTQPAPVVRIYLGRFAARSTFIQPQIVHAEAGEPTNIQALTFAVRAYGERVTK